MKRTLISAFFILMLNSYVFAQLDKVALNIGYENIHKSMGYIGAEYRFNNNDLKNHHGPLNIGIGTYLYKKESKFRVTPEIHLNKTWKHFLITELSASSKSLKPRDRKSTRLNSSHL